MATKKEVKTRKNIKTATKKTIKNVNPATKKTIKDVKHVVKSSKSASKVVVKDEKKKKKSNVLLILVAVVVVVILAVVIAIFSSKKPVQDIQQVNNINELTSSLNVKMNEPKDAENVSYGIENDDIARMEYQKKASDGSIMNFVLKSSSATEENITGLKNTWGTKILMTVICDDESDIEVESFVATDNPKIMKSEWYDNDLYYSMSTDNLVTREDFLQEVNRVIIDNHIEFD